MIQVYADLLWEFIHYIPTLSTEDFLIMGDQKYFP